ncbi:PDDEXK family nuclease [Oceanobacillus salinisoli]|uniref:Uma2 family endonuclease n=1 Tax=Oceanobacillus salinisoli TaxID=2678611 RepID=UPI0012E1AF11|nr:Uma2 family endonuclease [Oceanobacillus salinisoli]
MVIPGGNKKYTYADYDALEENVLYEVIDGKVISMSPSPTPKHQDVVDELTAEPIRQKAVTYVENALQTFLEAIHHDESYSNRVGIHQY